MSARWLAVLCGGMALSGACREGDPMVDDVGVTDAALTDAERDAVLDLVNEASTPLLDDDVGLDKRAAENIVLQRQGSDGVDATADDDLFDSIDELDAVPYVGPSALEKLVAYAHAQGMVDTTPSDDDALILAAANTLSLAVLDGDVGLDKRAAENIVQHRVGADQTAGTADDDPFESIEELDAIPYVGPAALASLLAYAKAHPPAAAGCLIISEYIEGAGNNNKALELYNCGNAPIALAEYGVCLVRNEATTCTTTGKLPESSLAPGAVRTLCRTRGGTFNDPMETIRERCEVELGGLLNFNGDDRILVFRDVDQDGAFGAADTVSDMLGRFGYQPPVTTWQDLSLRRCNFSKADGYAFYDHDDYFTTHAWGHQQDYGVAPSSGGCGDLALSPERFTVDLQAALASHYARYGADIAMMGGNDLASAQAAVSVSNVAEVTDPEENALGYDLADHRVFSHPDVVFPGSDIVWFGVYTNEGGLVELSSFN